MKRFSVGLGVAVLVTWGSMLSCEKEAIRPNYSENQVKTDQVDEVDIYRIPEICSDITSKRLIVNKQVTGNVYLYNDAKTLYVDILAVDGFGMEDAYLYVGPRSEVPVYLNGEIAPLKFNHKFLADDLGRAIRFKVPLKELDGNFVVSLMVKTIKGFGPYDELKLRETWVEGSQFNNGKGQIFPHHTTICMVNDPLELDE